MLSISNILSIRLFCDTLFIMKIFQIIINYYTKEVAFFNKELKLFFHASWLCFLIGTISAITYYQIDKESSMRIFMEILKSFKENGLDSLESELLFIKIFFNNLQVALIMLFLSTIPFLPLSLFLCLSNGFMLGLVGSIFYEKTFDVEQLLMSLLPHGIIELPIIFYTSAVGILIWKKIALSLFNKGSEVNINFFDLIKRVCFILIPLLLLAAFIESFITPLFI